MSTIRSLTVFALAGLLAACNRAQVVQRDHDRQAAYVAAAGAPVSSFRFLDLYSWEPLGDSAVAIYTRPNRAWLLDLTGDCPELPFANAIGLTSFGNKVSVRFDKVIAGRHTFPCPIAQIRPVDVARLKAVQQQQRQIESRPRASAGTGNGTGR